MTFIPPFLLFALVASLSLFAVVNNGEAQTQDKFRIDAGIDFLYDDNVWQFSNADREAFKADPSQTFFHDTKSLDDLVWQPFIHISAWLPGKEDKTKLTAGIKGDYYAKNTDLNFQTYKVGIKQRFPGEVLASASYTFTPDLFVGRSRERRTQTLVAEDLTIHVTALSLEKRFPTLDLGFEFQYSFLDYNAAFNEQDADTYGTEVFSDLYILSRLKTGIAYQFEIGRAVGRNNANLDNDLSYLSHRFQFQSQFQLSEMLIFDFFYKIKYKDFTTDLASDTSHFRREDVTHGLGAYLYYEINSWMEAAFGYERIRRLTNVQPGFFSYTENSYFLRVYVVF